MADASEDTIWTMKIASEDVDLSDETQDFRFLAQLTESNHATIPKRGEKDFEPNPTNHQSNLLAESRHAMHVALSSTRLHQPKAHILGVWHSDIRQCSVAQPRGPHFEKLGRAKGGITWLLPEEMLYLLERGNLDVRWGEEMGGGVGVPMSLQGAYAVVVGEGLGRVSRERWCVYAGLRRAGYIILRSPEWDGVEGEARNTAEGMTSNATGAVGLFAQLFTAIFGSRRLEEPLPLGPLVKPGCYKSYNDIYRRLALIPTHSPHSTAKTPPSSQATSPPFCICFHIYKPSPTFRKSAPGLPDFRIAVVDAHTTITPTLAELSALLESTPFAPPPERMSKQNFQKLRHGYRNVVLAVVDQGVLSYLRMSEAAFGEVKMYERFGSGLRGGKGGRGRGGGRGNGRGKR